MQLPVGLQSTSQNVNTSATINTQVVTTMLAAPGAGNRYRIWAVSLAMGLTTDTFTKLVGLFATGAGASRANLGCSLGQPSTEQEFPGGMALADNAVYNCTHSADVATQSIFITVYYTTEND